LVFNGVELAVNTEIGQMIYKHGNGIKEYYQANRIVFHYPSEHYLTVDGQTPRYGLEMQIEHSLLKSDDIAHTESVIKVKKAIVSVLFLESQLNQFGDPFLARLGIDSRRKNADGSYSVVDEG